MTEEEPAPDSKQEKSGVPGIQIGLMGLMLIVGIAIGVEYTGNASGEPRPVDTHRQEPDPGDNLVVKYRLDNLSASLRCASFERTPADEPADYKRVDVSNQIYERKPGPVIYRDSVVENGLGETNIWVESVCPSNYSAEIEGGELSIGRLQYKKTVYFRNGTSISSGSGECSLFETFGPREIGSYDGQVSEFRYEIYDECFGLHYQEGRDQ